jgi:tetratricopeptide (TPR) repeat protein
VACGALGPVVVVALGFLADVRPRGHGLTMTNNSPPRRASAKQTRPVLATDDAASTHRPLLATGGGVRARASAQQRQQAEDLVYDAWEASGERRAVLARDALALWPDCADAYVLLAQATASNLEQARELLEQGVAAGRRALRPATFADSVGDFWLIFETRPYMRARAALAATLWRLGRHQQAIDHQRDLLTLNPGDNQGLRFRHANWLLELGEHDELDALFAAHADESAPGFIYTKTLAAFARHDDTPTARALRARARELNPHIPDYLTARKTPPEQRPAYTVFGEETEAIDYAAGTRGSGPACPARWTGLSPDAPAVTA